MRGLVVKFVVRPSRYKMLQLCATRKGIASRRVVKRRGFREDGVRASIATLCAHTLWKRYILLLLQLLLIFAATHISWLYAPDFMVWKRSCPYSLFTKWTLFHNIASLCASWKLIAAFPRTKRGKAMNREFEFRPLATLAGGVVSSHARTIYTWVKANHVNSRMWDFKNDLRVYDKVKFVAP